METSEWFALAQQHHQEGRLTQAEQLYRRILQTDPRHAGAHYHLGLLAHKTGHAEAAIALLRRAIALDPPAALYHFNLGLVLQEQRRLDEAIASFRLALQLNPDDVDTLTRLGSAHRGQGQLVEAAECFRQALGLNPEHASTHSNLGIVLAMQGQGAEAVACFRQAIFLNPQLENGHSNLGLALKQQGQPEEAVACFRQAMRLPPHDAGGRYNLGLAFKELGRWEEAVECFRQVLRLNPKHAPAANSLGSILVEQGQLNEAVECYRQALRHNPQFVDALSNLGMVLKELGQPDEAIACCRQALRLNPDHAPAHNNLGSALLEQGQRAEAAECFRQALRLNPHDAGMHNNLGLALMDDQAQLEEAMASFRKAVELEPGRADFQLNLVHLMQHLCAWDGLGDLGRRIREAVDGDADPAGGAPLNPFSFLTLGFPPTTAAQQLQCARAWAQRCLESAGQAVPPRPRRGPGRIKLGYLSADFRMHPVAQLIVQVLEQHERNSFTVLGYSFGPDDRSPMRQRMRKAVDCFVDLAEASYLEAAQRIAADEVDILVDLTGYTQCARTQILALRPAPIQVNYLGYTATMGAPFIDYILVDDFIVPAEQQPFYLEQIVHLPGCYQVSDNQRPISQNLPARSACGLPEAGFVFCCFNHNYKITLELFTVWMDLLKAVPGSVLWLLASNRFVPPNLRREAEARGVEGQRLVFAPRVPLADHLARHRLADLFLDTFPFNAHVTASDALWSGCPVLTLAGQTFVSRVAGSLLRAMGLPELITISLEAYHAMALRLAREPGLLAWLRARLAASGRESRLFDPGRFVRNLERAYLAMWETYLAGMDPHPFSIREP